MDLTAERLREVFDYDPESGALKWKVVTSRRVRVGAEAGCVTKFARGGPYRVVRIDKTLYLAHRLVWLHVYGEWPDHEIDHVNRDGLDNRIANLRPASREQNQRNVGLSKRNKSGAKGVCFCKRRKKWKAGIYAGQEYRLGMFSTVEEASAAYARAADRLHGPYASTGD